MIEDPRHAFPPAPRTILVTGFGGFPGAPRNPTERIAAALAREALRFARLGIALRCSVLPVLYDGLQDRLDALATEHRPDAWLMLGVAGRRRRLCVETLARNRAGPLRPDAGGRRPAQRLVEGGATQRVATLPCHRVLAALRAAELPAQLSRDAGDYLCNAALYRAATLAPEVGFLHVPPLRARWPQGDARAMPGGLRRHVTFAQLRRAALLSVLALAHPTPPRSLRQGGAGPPARP